MRHLVFAAAAGLLVLTGCGGPTDDSASDACRTEVEDQLKAPSTMEFVDGETVTASDIDAIGDEDNGGDILRDVRGEVDAENSYGAQIRSTYVCELKWDGSSWEVLSADINS